MAEDRLRLIETTIVPEVWIDGIGKIEQIAGDAYRLLLYRTRRPLEGGPEEHEVVLSVLASRAAACATLALVNGFVNAGEAIEFTTLMH